MDSIHIVVMYMTHHHQGLTSADTSAAGNVYGIAIDMDNKSLRFYENGKDLGVAFDSSTATNFVGKESVAPMAGYIISLGLMNITLDKNPSSSHHLMVSNH